METMLFTLSLLKRDNEERRIVTLRLSSLLILLLGIKLVPIFSVSLLHFLFHIKFVDYSTRIMVKVAPAPPAIKVARPTSPKN